MSIDILRHDLQIEILTYLSPYQLSSVIPRVSKMWEQLSNDDRVWKPKITSMIEDAGIIITSDPSHKTRCEKHVGSKAVFCQLRHHIHAANERLEFNLEKLLERNLRHDIMIRLNREACEKADKKLRTSKRHICVLV